MLRRSTCLLLLLLLTAGCGDGPGNQARAPRAIPHVYTAFHPMTWVVERIAGDKAKVFCPLPPKADPRIWRPTPEIVARYQDDADLIVLHGAKLEAWTALRSLPRARLIDTSKALGDRLIQRKNAVKHTHGGVEHTHVDVDEHVWLDPQLLKRQAEAVRNALRDRYPAHAAAYEAGYEAIAKDLDALDAAFRALGGLQDGDWIYAAHPTHAYLAQAYGWRFVDVDLDPVVPPSAEELASLAKSVRFKPGRALWWERAPSEAVANAIREKTGLDSLVFSPGIAKSEEGGDYLAVMRANLERVKPVFAK
ncbi:MAG: zinc ABC transporter substrate-binding protein [Planctomycetota bacterium]|nr:zinc ABC transporter substrate-binding protein [Planctomycetota bacterium]